MSNLPVVIVKDVSRKGRLTKTIIQFDKDGSKYLSDPIAPASISEIKREYRILLPLHKFIIQNGYDYEFETYDYNGGLPEAGKKYRFQSWFTLDQLELIKDTSIKWKLKEFPKDGSICYDDISWDSIPPNTTEIKGYSDGENWITAKTYEEYIKKDILHLRTNK